MLSDGEQMSLVSLLGKNIETTSEFWEKADRHGYVATWCAIRKASQEKKKTIEHITNLIGNVVKEEGVLMYRSGVNPNEL